MYREEQMGGNFMMGVLTGALMGAGLALLFAPKAGNEIRAQLGQQYRGLAGRVGEQTEHLRTAAGEWRERRGRSELSDRTSPTDRTNISSTTESDRFPSSAPSV